MVFIAVLCMPSHLSHFHQSSHGELGTVTIPGSPQFYLQTLQTYHLPQASELSWSMFVVGLVDHVTMSESAEQLALDLAKEIAQARFCEALLKLSPCLPPNFMSGACYLLSVFVHTERRHTSPLTSPMHCL